MTLPPFFVMEIIAIYTGVYSASGNIVALKSVTQTVTQNQF
jgi:hypothetical protein